MMPAAPGRRPTNSLKLTNSVPDGQNACKHNRVWLATEDDDGALCGTCGALVTRDTLIGILSGHELE